MMQGIISRVIGIWVLFVLITGCNNVPPALPPTLPTESPTLIVASPRPLSPTTIPTETAPPTATPAPTFTPTAVPTPNKHGVHLLLDDGRNQWGQEVWAEHIAYARATVGAGGYVTELVRGDNLDPAYWQYFLDLCRDAELIPILRLATTFDLENNWWNAPVRDPDGSYSTVAQEYAAFIAALDWHTDRHYVIVGNEPNHGNEWSNRPDPANYARFLLDMGQAIHAADPQAAILNAGLDMYSPHTGGVPAPDGFIYIDADAFIEGMYRAHPSAFDQIDVWSSHSYPMGPFAAPPWEQTFKIDVFTPTLLEGRTPPPSGVPNRGVNGYEWELAKLEQLGIAPYPVLITETGWRHAESSDPNALDSGANLPSAEQVALYVELALYGNKGNYPDLPNAGWRPWSDDPRVLGVTFFAFDGLPREWGHTNWVLMDENGQITGVYPMARDAGQTE
jgi:hypothetical protein